jgi:hypothetical protein
MPGHETNGCVDAYLQHGEWWCTTGFQGGKPPIVSLINNSPYRVWLQQNQSHTSPGAELCINPGASISDLSGTAYTDDRWLWMSNNATPCS